MVGILITKLEFISTFLSSGGWLSLLCGILAVLSYGLFSKFYEPLTRSTKDSLLTAALLYGGAAVLLIISVLFCLPFFGWHFTLPDTIRVFNVPTSSTFVALVLLLLIFVMSLLYFSHIRTEAFARRSINMGVYTLLFQINVVVIAFIDWAVYQTPLSVYMILGGILILLSSSGALIAYYFAPQNRLLAITLSRGVVLLGIVSAVSCGLALYIDGEIGRHYIFNGDYSNNFLAPFLLYEMLTFGLPFLWAFITLSHSKTPRYVWQQLRKEFNRSRKNYFFSSLFSACQFVFSVLALSLPGPRFFVAMVLALSPLFSILLDRNKRSPTTQAFEYGCGLVSAIGLFLLITISR